MRQATEAFSVAPDLPDAGDGDPTPCPTCHENPADIRDGTCEVCDTHCQRQGYGTRREYLYELDTDQRVSASQRVKDEEAAAE